MMSLTTAKRHKADAQLSSTLRLIFSDNQKLDEELLSVVAAVAVHAVHGEQE
jgi:hypothetical protein